MKLEVNYDLLTKICEAEKGVIVRRVVAETCAIAGFVSLLSFFINMDDLKQFGEDTLYAFGITSLQVLMPPFLHAPRKKEEAIKELKSLASKLRQLKVSTDDELLLQSEVYETKYKVSFDEGVIPKIIQNKYIVVPTHDDREVSLLQEHVIGTKEYTLSVGKPERQKQFKLAYNGI